MTNEEARRMVDEQAAKLGEHFEACQILVSWNENGETKSIYSGCGNWFARMGMLHEMIEDDKAMIQANRMSTKVDSDT